MLIRLVVVGDAGCAPLIARFAQHLSLEPPEDAPGELETELVDGELGFDAVGRRVAVRELSPEMLGGRPHDELLSLSDLPPEIKRYLARVDGAAIVVDAATRRGGFQTARRWRRTLGSIKSECPALLILGGDSDALDAREEDALNDEIRGLGFIAWRFADAKSSDDDEVVDAFGTLLDYCSATRGLSFITHDEPPGGYSMTCSGGSETGCFVM